MNIVKENIDDLSATLTVQIAKADYEGNVKKTLNNYRRKAEIKGFRVGNAPIELIRKMYGASVLGDEINKLISEELDKYIKNEKIDILGEPIPCEEKQKPIDWDNPSDYEFVYEIGYAPKFDIKIDKTLKVPYYNINISDDDKKKHVENICQRYGKMEDSKKTIKDDLVKVDLTQTGDEAMNVEDTYISLRTIDEKHQKNLIGLKIGDTIEIDLNKIFANDADRARTLHLKPEELSNVKSMKFEAKVKEIKTLKKAEINQELFDAAYGKGTIKDEADFMKHVDEELKQAYASESNYKFATDAREMLVEKVGMKLPENFLKKWLLLINEGKLTKEQVDQDFGAFSKDLAWQIIRDRIAKDNNMTVNDDEMKGEATRLARYQLSQYGLSNLPDDQMAEFAERILQDKKQTRGMVERVIEDKVFAFLKENVKLTEKNVSIDDFAKLFENK